jgi:peptide/nickel transport system permease protein
LNSTLKYLIKRVAAYLIVVFGALIINFTVPRFAPGSPFEGVISKMETQGILYGYDTLIKEYREMFGLDQNLQTQFFNYVYQLFRGNLGYSISNFPLRIDQLILSALPYTIKLLSVAIIISWLLGTLLGAYAGWKGGKSKFTQILSTLSLGLNMIPYFILAMVLVYFLGYTWHLFPFSGSHTPTLIPDFSLNFFLDEIYHMILPALSIIIGSLGGWFLSMRSIMVSLRGEDYILLAEAKGLSNKRIMVKYSLRNALLPQITGLAMTFGHILGGSLMAEVIFAYPGMGYLLFMSIGNQDYPMIQGLTLIMSISVATAMLLIELIYPLIDPRIKTSK